MSKTLPIIALLKRKAYLFAFLLIFGALFYANYYLMVNLPGHRDEMCVMGAGLNPLNMVFAFAMSALVGFVVIGFVENIKLKAKVSKAKLGSASFFGLATGMLTTFCTLCTLPVLTLFGLSIPIAFFTDYEIYFKAISLILLGLSFYFVNRALAKKCKICVL